MENAVSGFRCTGIVLPSSDFLEDPRVVDPPSDKTLPTSTEVANQIPSQDQTSTLEQVKESCPATAETTPMPFASTEAASSPAAEEPPSSDHVSFSLIMKLPSLTEKKKSKGSEESSIITSSPYKNLLVEKITEQNEKSKRASQTKKSIKEQPA